LSDWGLVELGALNPNLEYLDIWTQSPNITQSAVAILKDSLPNICPRKFTVCINTDEDSDDDSSESQSEGEGENEEDVEQTGSEQEEEEDE